ncbi:MAG: DNA repair protein RadA, partial [Alphaproteobacteria bacterium]|nr:DNA repair protein RadA [Alphaproteobacteria bacterium]
MARTDPRFVCQSCGASRPRWAGKCDACGAWNSIAEEIPREAAPRGLGSGKGRAIPFTNLDGEHGEVARHASGMAELDRVVGGGLVAGSSVLLAGDPGIGKSTLLLQAAGTLAANGVSCAYISGEEGVEQIRLRATRLGITDAPVQLAAATNVRDILAGLESAAPPDIVVVDSIQTMYLDSLDSAPGTVSQVRGAAQELIRHAKRSGSVLFLVGHVTKDGQIAGPRVLEHMVDAVLYFEGERGHQFRIVRAVKNRFGATDEIGVFEMTGAGLAEVPNPSTLFLNPERGPISGAAVFAGIEGTRPVLVEIQALVALGPPGSPRRTTVGWDSGRLAMVLAVLEARAGLRLGASDVFLNVAGGLRINEPAADLAVAAAIVSSYSDRPVREGTVVFGEIGLSGEVRPVVQAAARLKEAAKLGFSQAIAPPSARRPAREGG